MFAEKKTVTIGRDARCTVQLADPVISKVQCTLSVNEASGWTLTDGASEQPSTNGSWLYLNEAFEVYSGMVLKFQQTVLQAKLFKR